MFFEKISSGWPGVKKKISKNVDFSLWGNCATTQNTFFDIFKWDQNHENHTLGAKMWKKCNLGKPQPLKLRFFLTEWFLRGL